MSAEPRWEMDASEQAWMAVVAQNGPTYTLYHAGPGLAYRLREADAMSDAHQIHREEIERLQFSRADVLAVDLDRMSVQVARDAVPVSVHHVRVSPLSIALELTEELDIHARDWIAHALSDFRDHLVAVALAAQRAMKGEDELTG